MAEIITTVNTGKDTKMEINKKGDEDFPLKIIDQSKTVSTRNVVPNKREIEKKDVDKIINKLKGIEEIKEKPTRRDRAMSKEEADKINEEMESIEEEEVKTTRGRKKKEE